MKIAIHIRKNSPKVPDATHSLYLQRHRVGASWISRGQLMVSVAQKVGKDWRQVIFP